MRGNILKRIMTEKLVRWKKSGMPGVFRMCGLHGVGKSTLVLDFASKNIENYLYIDFKTNCLANAYFNEHFNNKADFSADCLIDAVTSFYGIKRSLLRDITVIFDSTEQVKGLSGCFDKLEPSLEKDTSAHFIEISNSRINTENVLYPLSFEELLMNMGKTWLLEAIRGHFDTMNSMPLILHDEIMNLFIDYLHTGGMPEAVSVYLTAGMALNLPNVLDNCCSLLSSALSDRGEKIFNSIPGQLLDNSRFEFTQLRRGAVLGDYEKEICSMSDEFIISYIRKSGQDKLLRLYYTDCGMLYSKMVSDRKLKPYGIDDKQDLDISKILIRNMLNSWFEKQSYEKNYWQSDGKAEIEFVLRKDGNRNGIPVEVTDERDRHSRKLEAYMKLNVTEKAFVLSNEPDYVKKGITIRIPYYAYFCL